MDKNIKKIIKILCLIVILAIITVICILSVSFNNANIEDMSTPIHITPIKEEKIMPKSVPATPTVKPMTRDENNMPKSDYKVPEIG